MAVAIRFFFFLLAFANLAVADCSHPHHSTHNQLYPSVQVQISPKPLRENIAFSVLGEGGRRNARFNGTLGALYNENNLFKISGEYLTQKLGYNYSSGQIHKWRNQGAVAVAYRRLFSSWISTFDLSGYYSHAASKSLRAFFCSSGAALLRNIAGSNAGGAALGFTFQPWRYTSIEFDADYDYVSYNRKFSHNKRVSGFGGAINWHQGFPGNFSLDAGAELRRPFNFYNALLSWHAKRSGFSIGIFGNYTQGKSHLPNAINAGIQLSYAGRDSQAECCEESTDICPTLVSWVATPAVYMPEVLAIPEEAFLVGAAAAAAVITGDPPILDPIPDQFILAVPYTINIASFLVQGSAPLTYSATGLPVGTTINSSSGVITGINPRDGTINPVTVTVTNPFGSSSQSFNIIFCETPDIAFPGSGEVFGPFTQGSSEGITVIAGGGPVLTYSVVSGAAFFANPSMPQLTFVTTAIGSHSVTIEVTNECGQFDEVPFSFIVVP